MRVKAQSWCQVNHGTCGQPLERMTPKNDAWGTKKSLRGMIYTNDDAWGTKKGSSKHVTIRVGGGP